ncbi:hypothetical protein BVRB_9g213490 [Beta vulgaris subsp. vulgaris]|nr:hypothetical protein BVRB_9g213490 [Beta vulgaris subsp. vulgaris]
MPDGLEFPLSKTHVYWVLDIPAGLKTVPLYGDDADKGGDEVMRLFDVYGYTSRSGVMGIKASVINQVVEGEISSDAEFKKAFFMMALNDLICPTTCQRMCVNLLYVVVVADRAHEYDWCSLLLDHLMNAIGGFAKRDLDRLCRPPLMWGTFPRIRAWSTVDVNKVKKEDLLASRDYDKLGAIDVAYGGKHPLEARDVTTSAEDVEEMS